VCQPPQPEFVQVAQRNEQIPSLIALTIGPAIAIFNPLNPDGDDAIQYASGWEA
jgi:hypothetical protein